VRLGCFYANAFSKAQIGHPGCRDDRSTGGFRRISGLEYWPLPKTGGSRGVNATWERCDWWRSNGTGQRSTLSDPCHLAA
jgi:hypothetical protein